MGGCGIVHCNHRSKAEMTFQKYFGKPTHTALRKCHMYLKYCPHDLVVYVCNIHCCMFSDIKYSIHITCGAILLVLGCPRQFVFNLWNYMVSAVVLLWGFSGVKPLSLLFSWSGYGHTKISQDYIE